MQLNETTNRSSTTTSWLLPALALTLLVGGGVAAQQAPPTGMETEVEAEAPSAPDETVEGGAFTEGEKEAASPAQEVMAADRALSSALNAGDREVFAALLAEDAVFLSGQGALRGRDAVVAGWTPLMAEDRVATLTWEPAGARVAASLDLAYTVGNYVLTVQRSEDEPAEDRGRYISVWRRHEQTGAWQAVADGPLRRDRAAYLEVELERAGLIGPGSGAALVFRPERIVRSEAGDLSYTVGTYEASRLAADGADETVATGTWLAVWATDPETGARRLLPAGDSVTPPPQTDAPVPPPPEPDAGEAPELH